MGMITKKTILIDAGHGGMYEGKYMTEPKWGKFYKHSSEFTAYEGVTNRKIATLLMDKMKGAKIPYFQIHHDYYDTSLGALVNKANAIAQPAQDFLYLSIHSNAGKGYGFEVFTSKGETKSDPFAEIICNGLKHNFPYYHLRQDTRDGDMDKEENFYVLKNTNCPAVLVELLFFDELNQAVFLNSAIGQEKLATCLFKSIEKIMAL